MSGGSKSPKAKSRTHKPREIVREQQKEQNSQNSKTGARHPPAGCVATRQRDWRPGYTGLWQRTNKNVSFRMARRPRRISITSKLLTVGTKRETIARDIKRKIKRIGLLTILAAAMCDNSTRVEAV